MSEEIEIPVEWIESGKQGETLYNRKAMRHACTQTLDLFLAECIKTVEAKEGERIEYEHLLDDDISDNPTMNVLMEIRHELEQIAKRMKGE